MRLILITLFFTTFLSAEYLRTIRLGAFTTQSRAQEELAKVNIFVKNNSNITDFQKIWDFEFKVKKSGAHYLTIVSPMRDKEVLQEVIDTLRLSYPDAYVRKLKFAPAFTMKKLTVESPIESNEGAEVNTPEAFNIENDTELPQEIISEDETELPEIIQEIPVEEEIIKLKPVKKPEPIIQKKKEVEPLAYNFDEKEVFVKEKESGTNTTDVYEILFFVTLILLLLVSSLLYRYKRKSIFCKDREIETHEIFTKKDIEIRHKDSFLTHAKTSVATIHNFTNLLLEFDLTQIQKDYIQRIRSSSEHLLNTVNNTLDITKLKNETLRIENIEFDLNEMLRKVSKIISLEAKNDETVFELNVEDDVPAFIFGDPTRIRQVLINLLGNSVKFTKNGKISLTIKTLYNYTHAITLGFIVKDTGVGMSSEQVNDILDSSTEIVEDGTVGLGLSVTKQLIEMMNGEIKIYSTEDVGTTFTFTLKFNVIR
ncbi:ATP-binding protein [Sulfurimonas sp.]|uniref:sensor histidine kinase n=1 Tax=Sulfurimonas sp. TaxID=2022749 RepID=UPI0039E6970E